MKKKIIWIMVSCLMVLSLVIASCGEKEKEEEKTSSDVPQYGGTLNLSMLGDVNDYLPWNIFTSMPVQMSNEWLWNGDWTKGPAGGYGANIVGYEASTRVTGTQAYYIAESMRWEADPGGETGTLYIKIRDGIHYGLDPDNPASVLVGGREVTLDDVIWNFDIRMNDERSHPGLFLHTGFPWTNGIYGKKISANEVSYTFPIAQLLNGIMLLCDGAQIFPPELDTVYHADSTTDWKVCFGAGAFMIDDCIAGNMLSLKRNPNYWGKDPIGPGKGNQLPYLDGVKFIIMPDLSTRQAAFRTAQLDQMGGFSIEDKARMISENSLLKQAVGMMASANLLGMRTDLEGTPYADVNVRRAMMMATDFNEINEGLYQGLGHILTWPYWKQKGYEGLYLGLEDEDMPDTIKELYTYNPDKAKELLANAGYPEGFKAEVLLTQDQVDYYSVMKEMWAKVGIELEFNIQEFGAFYSMMTQVSYEQMIAAFIPPPSSWPEVAGYTGITISNFSRINDPFVNAATDHMLTTAITDLPAAMIETRELMKYLLEGAWVIPSPRYPTYTMWWPWLKNYSGENSVGWLSAIWPWWVWEDQDLKKSMGY